MPNLVMGFINFSLKYNTGKINIVMTFIRFGSQKIWHVKL